mmetsp:Transcript_17532/g.42075  ORF Transcript_17532/g.42075 Transcript_17532/m.42075 type:complete len:167 (-) Transcript_17532:5401-5901(-)
MEHGKSILLTCAVLTALTKHQCGERGGSARLAEGTTAAAPQGRGFLPSRSPPRSAAQAAVPRPSRAGGLRPPSVPAHTWLPLGRGPLPVVEEGKERRGRGDGTDSTPHPPSPPSAAVGAAALDTAARGGRKEAERPRSRPVVLVGAAAEGSANLPCEEGDLAARGD